MGGYKLTEKRRNGYKSFPKSLVEGIFWDKVKQKLSDVLENLQSRVAELEEGGGGGGGGTADVSAVIQTNGAIWNIDGTSGVTTTSKSEAAALLGVSEEIFDEIIAGNDARSLAIPNATTGEKIVTNFNGYHRYNEYEDEAVVDTMTTILYTEGNTYRTVYISVYEAEGVDTSYSIFGFASSGGE